MQTPHLIIVGAGMAGLSAAFEAASLGAAFDVYERLPRVGGLVTTFDEGGFRFDSGAHRLHDRVPDVTGRLRSLLAPHLQQVSAPSHIHSQGRLIEFPLAPLDVARALGPLAGARIALEVLAARLGGGRSGDDFESFAVRRYGRTLAERFLLGYSEKLWGLPCRRLSAALAGARLKGLSLASLLTEAVRGPSPRPRHLEGGFLYPSLGIGMVAEALADASGRERIRTGRSLDRLRHDGRRVTAVVCGGESLEAQQVVSTMPLDQLVLALDPPAPPAVQQAARSLRFRDLLLVALRLDRPSVMASATLYLPDPGLPFTRIYEPRNRSRQMSPPGRTSLVAEVPFPHGEPPPDADELAAGLRRFVVAAGWVRSEEIAGHTVRHIPHAYPVLEVGSERAIGLVMAHLSGLGNLRVCGRNGTFTYASMHDAILAGAAAARAALGVAPPAGAGA